GGSLRPRRGDSLPAQRSGDPGGAAEPAGRVAQRAATAAELHRLHLLHGLRRRRGLGPAATARAALRPRGGDLRHRHLPPPPRDRSAARSEEHTSELQSRFDLVCRLLLEKKKYI